MHRSGEPYYGAANHPGRRATSPATAGIHRPDGLTPPEISGFDETTYSPRSGRRTCCCKVKGRWFQGMREVRMSAPARRLQPDWRMGYRNRLNCTCVQHYSAATAPWRTTADNWMPTT
ncbi:MAG: hypothetical protein JWP83_5369 [Mycobacterium sp.]|jgi:hypothetical protein|nr:hypothetical protein [Mycobacterium sp.]